jgi:hypothetical protein
MGRDGVTVATCFFSLLVLSVMVTAQTPDLSKQSTLYVVGYAHLDTEWRWCVSRSRDRDRALLSESFVKLSSRQGGHPPPPATSTFPFCRSVAV